LFFRGADMGGFDTHERITPLVGLCLECEAAPLKNKMNSSKRVRGYKQATPLGEWRLHKR
jgi:hypothetical protein